MPKRIEMGTDIAMVGVWDPGVDLHDKPGDYRDFIEAKALAGRLFFIDTVADGGFHTDVYVDEQPAPETLAFYKTPDRRFLIASESGRLIAGGIEDFANLQPQITSPADEFNVTPGRYALSVYERDEDQYLEVLKKEVGESDMDYYATRFNGCTHGCLAFIAAVILGAVSWVLTDVYPWLWAVTGLLVALGITYITIRTRTLIKDERYRDIHQRIGKIEERFSSFIFILESLSDNEEVEGGWHELS